VARVRSPLQEIGFAFLPNRVVSPGAIRLLIGGQVALAPLDLHLLGFRDLTRVGELTSGRVDRDHDRTLFGECNGCLTGATTEVEHPLPSRVAHEP